MLEPLWTKGQPVPNLLLIATTLREEFGEAAAALRREGAPFFGGQGLAEPITATRRTR